MRAVRITGPGRVSATEVTYDAPVPSFGPAQVLVAVKAVGINPFDVKVRSGDIPVPGQRALPITLGGDFAGVVEEVGNEVADIHKGDEVYGQGLVHAGGSGAFAELVAANRANISVKPERASSLEAAGLPLAGASAVQALEDNIRLSSGQKILIHGGPEGSVISRSNWRNRWGRRSR